jgi:hypothetical protein
MPFLDPRAAPPRQARPAFPECRDGVVKDQLESWRGRG